MGPLSYLHSGLLKSRRTVWILPYCIHNRRRNEFPPGSRIHGEEEQGSDSHGGVTSFVEAHYVVVVDEVRDVVEGHGGA